MSKILNRTVHLSVQYIVDCGTKIGLAGCLGGKSDPVYEFINQYGILEEEYYAYVGRDQSCALDDNKDLNAKLLWPKIRVHKVDRIEKKNIKRYLHYLGPAVCGFDAEPKDIFLYGLVIKRRTN
ncbi:hypothetical protein Ciccas_012651 [Cichlidogyrus casuarinus]|uniref:Peptidase C1A papain C-terminal domain-containing protein n=1 Tax=Cichlidogyrus casuarinus TaxID=1844966 RepID=A0ABD2PPL3_9PLAT